ncbi:MAG: hypothetical protein HYR85_14585 [Planctomycetes bacterium]|nr:hypothetical protein [Planctomycetota bacterium]
MTKRCALFPVVLALATPLAAAQDKSSFQQLLDELRQKGVLDEATTKRIGDAAAKEDQGSSANIGYDKGFSFKSKDEKFSLKVNGYGQFRYSYTDRDEDVPGNSADKSAFRNRRVRVSFSGTAFEPWVTYKLQWENAGGSLSLRDYYIDLYDKKSTPGIGVKFGQFKTPFSRQFLTSAQNLQIVERALTNDTSGTDLAFDRDQGVAIHGKPFGSEFNVEYTTGLFNGNGQNQSDNVDVGLLWVSRLDWNILGEPGYSEGDVEDSQDAKFAVGSSYAYNIVTPATGPTANIDTAQSRLEIDTIFKLMGFSLQSEYFVSNETPDDHVAADVNGGINSKGIYVQSGFFVMPKELEIAGRYTYFDRDRVGEPNRQEVIGGVNYYFSQSHWWKLQADVRYLEPARDPGSDNYETQYIVQMQVSF